MKFILPILIIMLVFHDKLCAQYTEQGTIRYERKVNTYAQIEDDGYGDWLERNKAQVPKFRINDFDLLFNMDESVYKRVKLPDDKEDSWWDGPATDNNVYTDFKTRQVAASKLIFEKTFLVKDTMRQMQWKIMDEIRTIADYKCRKAVGKICDSVYVVAFYTTDIVASGGPEMFGGLPGMIMELAIPRLHTTWTATRVDIIHPNPGDITAPVKGKQVTEQQLYETLKQSFSDWGKETNRNLWWSVL